MKLGQADIDIAAANLLRFARKVDTTRIGEPATLAVCPTVSTTARAVDSAQAESSALISALDGPKYCAEWRVRRRRSNVGLAKWGVR